MEKVTAHNTVLDVVVDDEIQFLVGEAVMFSKDAVDFVYYRFAKPRLECLNGPCAILLIFVGYVF